jgi:hypothetical protein
MAISINNLSGYQDLGNLYGNVPGGINSGGTFSTGYIPGALGLSGVEGSSIIKNPGSDTEKMAGKISSPAECESCANRKYQDGSNEMVSFKAPTNISPEAAPAAVRAHEQEHVSNAYRKAAKDDGEVIMASVTIKMSVCDECGRSYVAGGETMTKIRYSNEDNPYQKNRKENDAAILRGMNVNQQG